jgi:hypothetical protein
MSRTYRSVNTRPALIGTRTRHDFVGQPGGEPETALEAPTVRAC